MNNIIVCLLFFANKEKKLSAAGKAHYPEPILWAVPTGNSMNTMNGLWHTVSHVLLKFPGTWFSVSFATFSGMPGIHIPGESAPLVLCAMCNLQYSRQITASHEQ